MSRVDFSFRLFSASVTMNDPKGIYVTSLIRKGEVGSESKEVWDDVKSGIREVYTDLTREFLAEERGKPLRHRRKNRKN